MKNRNKNTKKEVNELFRNIVNQYKKDYASELKKHKNQQSEINREKKIQKNVIYANILPIILILIAVAVVFTILYLCFGGWLWGVVIAAFVLLITILTCYNNMIKKEVKRNKELKDMRFEIWEKALKNNVRHHYSEQSFIKHLLVYHKIGLIHKTVVVIVSMCFTVTTVCILRGLSINNVISLVVACIANIIFNFLGNVLTAVYSEDYYFECFKNDYVLR